MMNFIVYDPNTGEIVVSGVCKPEDFNAQARDGLLVMEGVGEYLTNYVQNGEIQTYTAEQAQLKATTQLPYMKWSNQTFSWYDKRNQAQILTQADYAAKLERNELLYKSDWTQIPNNPLTPAKQAEWAVYRQELRDITDQPGYPLNIVWPTPPR